VFTAGIGENSAAIREASCRGLSGFGIEIDRVRNAAAPRAGPEIQRAGGAVKVLVIPTNEELEIAQETLACIRAQGEPSSG